MLKNIPAFVLTAMAFTATNSNAFAGSTAAEASHAKIQSAWAELQNRQNSSQAIAKMHTLPVTAISSTIDLSSDEITPQGSGTRKIEPVHSQKSWPSSMIGIF